MLSFFASTQRAERLCMSLTVICGPAASSENWPTENMSDDRWGVVSISCFFTSLKSNSWIDRHLIGQLAHWTASPLHVLVILVHHPVCSPLLYPMAQIQHVAVGSVEGLCAGGSVLPPHTDGEAISTGCLLSCSWLFKASLSCIADWCSESNSLSCSCCLTPIASVACCNSFSSDDARWLLSCTWSFRASLSCSCCITDWCSSWFFSVTSCSWYSECDFYLPVDFQGCGLFPGGFQLCGMWGLIDTPALPHPHRDDYCLLASL